MFQFMLVVGLVLAYYGYAVTKNPRIWADQGRDAIKEENWNRYVRYNGQFAMYAGFLMAALDALDMAVDLSTAIYLLILLAVWPSFCIPSPTGCTKTRAPGTPGPAWKPKSRSASA